MNRRGMVMAMGSLAGVAAIAALHGSSNAQDTLQPTVDALETRVADLKTSVAKRDAKIDNLETQIATSPTATSTPAQDANQGSFGIWDITVNQATYIGSVGGGDNVAVALGAFLLVDLTATNNGNAPQRFPNDEMFVMIDDTRTYHYALEATVDYFVYQLGGSAIADVQPGLPTPLSLLFDIPTTGTTFKLVDKSNELAVTLSPVTP